METEPQGTSTTMATSGGLGRLCRAAFHGLAALTYGYALVWTFITWASASREGPNKNEQQLMDYGPWRFLTHNCMMLQFIFHSLALATDLVQVGPALLKARDFLFTSLAFPIGTYVSLSFWTICLLLGPNQIARPQPGVHYSIWHNHVSHTILIPVNLIEFLLVQKVYPNHRRAVAAIIGFLLAYSAFSLFIRCRTGKFAYPFLDNLGPTGLTLVASSTFIFTLIAYKLGHLFHNWCHHTRGAAIKVGSIVQPADGLFDLEAVR